MSPPEKEPDAAINFLPTAKSRIAVAMSGGIDSNVTAHWLAAQGHEVVGLTAWTLNGPGKCCNDALVNAGRVCEMLGVPYDTVDLRGEFAHYVMDYYHEAYEAGLTPNPCVECNRFVKWELLVRYAVDELGVDYVATGHYARLQQGAAGPRLFRPRDTRKDQTYMLSRVYPRDLSRALFPLGDWVKPDVVAYAREHNLPNANGGESQDVCFVLDGQANYLRGVLGQRPGPVVDVDTGRQVGAHDGYYQFTLGQRRGVKVAAGRPIYVVRIDPGTDTVYVGDARHLETTAFRVIHPSWLAGESPALPFEAMVKIRYNTPAAPARVTADPDTPGQLLVSAATPLSAVTPGQIAAFYTADDRELLGGGYIEQTLTRADFDPHLAQSLPDLTCRLP
ncbi:MAG: tRNA 2-thiouridine(34) synthase MnmA [Candidatus Melainabacteria bacterium]